MPLPPLRRRLLQAAALSPWLSALPRSQAQPTAGAYPNKPVRLIIPVPGRGATDYAARAIGSALGELWHQPIVFDNRSGAGSTIGTEAGAKAPADGYTLVLGIPAGVSIAPHIYPKLGYDPLTDMLPAAGFATSPLVVVVPADSPFKTLRELLAYARANPNKLSYASNGSGSLPHLTTEWFLSQTKTQMVHVPTAAARRPCPTSSRAARR